MNDGFFDPSDPFGMQTPMTPDLNKMHTTGVPKMLVVIFIIDCSRTMEGDRIGAVNAAMQELQYKLTEFKNEYSLDLKVAVMSFASSAKWEIGLTPIEELNFETIRTRPGLTSYGAAFHELNKVLRKESFMKHTGKIAPPAIMFLTDGEPNDDYQDDLHDLLKNGWFSNASRSAVLLGDAIDNPMAKDAVSHFVKDGNNDIVSASDSTVIIDKIRIATMHTIAGDPMQNDGAEGDGTDGRNSIDSNSQPDNSLNNNQSPLSDPNVFDSQTDFPPFPSSTSDSGDINDPFGNGSAVNTSNGTDSSEPDASSVNNNVSNDANDTDPFGGGDNPFATLSNPFSDGTNTTGGDSSDPFGGGNDPFGSMV